MSIQIKSLTVSGFLGIPDETKTFTNVNKLETNTIKLLYVLSKVLRDKSDLIVRDQYAKKHLSETIAKTMTDVFMIENLSQLIKTDSSHVNVRIEFTNDQFVALSFNARNKRKVTVEEVNANNDLVNHWGNVYLPELPFIPISNSLIGLSFERNISQIVSSTVIDGLLKLGTFVAKHPPLSDLIKFIDDKVGEKLIYERTSGLFYLGKKKTPFSLVPKNIARLMEIYALIERNHIKQGTYLFWEFPETSLDENSIHYIVQELDKEGIQVFMGID